ncbi:glycosyl transferase [Salipiger aestuarii]|uniref:Teichuronic acid biosynthesis glycosyltransferase TuaG n=1 Tax=Salipiger aestuarii TaxID=568098 RepID=A0A327XHV7_9RHOB|nr:glycosyltransferase family 2 protein [Salipiger aestuarii]EIE49044.1 hypothetical protein C357_20777 [Citreicella sp. 357]KAA8606406.1 glycosyl transferase [Salipiger aestuarii]KAB2534443.1 glycosyl transferase [Salipiger aestuarii]RAK08423.1 teichuronic acid biosynthesis glycosyltransferase TuaG [Salipiger aestuarii]
MSGEPLLGPEGSDPLVSVIVPVFNAGPVLERAVASVLAQELGDWELLLIDDGSTDTSAAVIETLAARDPRIRGLSQGRNSGAAAARNAGLDAARGRYIAFLDADDVWLPQKLRLQLAYMTAQGAAFSYTGFWRMNGAGQFRVRVPARVDHRTLLRHNVIGCLTAIYDRSVLGAVPMPEFARSHDYALWLDILSRIEFAAGLDEPLALYFRTKGSLTSSRLKSLAGTWEVYRAHQKLSRSASAGKLAGHVFGRYRKRH